MTAPTGPTPGAPAPTPAPAPAGPVPTPPPTPTPAPWSPDSLPPEGKAWMDQQIAAVDKKGRLDTKANAAAEAEKAITARLAQALNLAPAQGGPPTVESLATQLTEMQARLEESAARAEEAETTAQISATAARLGANAAALLDSRRFVEKLNGIEADSEHAYNTAVEKLITAELTANPALKSAGGPAAPPPPSGSDFSGAGGQTAPITEAQLAQMTPEQIAQAMSEGKLKHLL